MTFSPQSDYALAVTSRAKAAAPGGRVKSDTAFDAYRIQGDAAAANQKRWCRALHSALRGTRILR